MGTTGLIAGFFLLVVWLMIRGARKNEEEIGRDTLRRIRAKECEDALRAARTSAQPDGSE